MALSAVDRMGSQASGVVLKRRIIGPLASFRSRVVDGR